MPNRLIKRSYTEMLRLRVLDLEDRYWKLNIRSQELMNRVERLLSQVEIAERKFVEHPNLAYLLEDVRKTKIELSSYIMQSPELKALLRTYTAEPHESDNHSAEYAAKGVVNRIDNKSKRLK